MVQSIGQSIPPGGMTATQPVTPAGTTTPSDIMAAVEALTPIQARFRQQSTFLMVALPQASFTAPGLGQPVAVQLSNVGLAVLLMTEWNAVITVANSATNAATFTVSPQFPLNMIANTQIQINGGAAIYNVSGVNDYNIWTRNRLGSKRIQTYQQGWAAALGISMNPAILQVNTLGSNLTVTNSTAIATKLSGVASVSVAGSASTLNTWTLRWVTFERIVLDLDSLIGAPPLQNNQTFVQVTRQLVGALSGTRNDLQVPFYSAAGSLTFTLTSCTADTTYMFASVPPDAGLYQALVANSFQSQEQRNFTTQVTGSEAFSYPIPTNNYVVALHNQAVDTNGASILGYDSTSGFGLLKLVYAGNSIIPVRDFPYRQRAWDYYTHAVDPYTVGGYRLWDGEATSDSINASDNMGWLDTYNTSQPTELMDVGASASTPLTSNIAREVVLTGNVQQVGGGS